MSPPLSWPVQLDKPMTHSLSNSVLPQQLLQRNKSHILDKAGQTNNSLCNNSGFAEINMHMTKAKKDNVKTHKVNKIWMNAYWENKTYINLHNESNIYVVVHKENKSRANKQKEKESYKNRWHMENKIFKMVYNNKPGCKTRTASSRTRRRTRKKTVTRSTMSTTLRTSARTVTTIRMTSTT